MVARGAQIVQDCTSLTPVTIISTRGGIRDDPIKPRDEVGRVSGIPRKALRHFDVDRAGRRVRVYVEHFLIGALVPGAKKQPAGLANGQVALSIEIPPISLQGEALHDLAILDDLEMPHSNRGAERNPVVKRSGCLQRDRIAGMLAAQLQHEKRSVARESQAGLEGREQRLRTGVAAGVDEYPVHAHGTAQVRVIGHGVGTCAGRDAVA